MSNTYTEPVRTYLTKEQNRLMKQKRQELGYPDIAKFIRRLIMEGLKRDYKFELPDTADSSSV